MFCIECGRELGEDDKFCSFCGTEVKAEAENSEPEVNESNEQPVEEVKEENISQQTEKAESVAKAEPAGPVESVENPQSEQKKKFNILLNNKTIAIAAAVAVAVIAIIAVVIIRLRDQSNTRISLNAELLKDYENGGINISTGRSSSFSINIFPADSNIDERITDATIFLYSGEGDVSDDPLLVIDGENGTGNSKSNSLSNGEYKIEVRADGYFDYFADITVADGEQINVFLTPVPQEGTIIYRVDWEGEQDLDLCAFNGTDSVYVSIGNNEDSLGTNINCDNSSDKGFELLYLPQIDANVVRAVYVVDSKAAKEWTDSSMEQDGVRVTAYDSKGELYSLVADSQNTAPVWSVGYVYLGEAYPDTEDYISYCGGYNKWCQYIKEGQSQRISETLLALNSLGANAIPTFNPETENYFPAARTAGKSWDMTVFYALEAELESPGYYGKNLCLLKKLQVRNELTNNIVDYDIYLNPETLLPNKIVSIEYISSGIEVYEYYYNNNGKVNFIFHYYADNYVSTYATVGKAGERYLFSDDSLVTWRVVQEGNVVNNYCYGEDERQRLYEGTWNNKSIWEYSSLNSEMQSLFDDNEKRMINYAYNVYNLVINTEPVGRIIGVLYKGNYEPCPNVDVEVYDRTFCRLLYTAKTDENGEYCIYVPTENNVYNLRIKGSTAENSCDIYNINISSGDIVYYVDASYYFETETEKQEVSLYIGNAFEGYGSNIVDANIYVRRGINNRAGEVILSSVTDYSGYVEILLIPGVYTIEASKSGYESIFYTIISNPYYSNKYEYYTPPTLSDGEYAIVLSWGEYPYDLDSHLFTSGEGTSTHVWYGDRYDSLNSFLDVDDTQSYGPETITIISYNQNLYYKYCVIDYSNSSRGRYNSSDMSFSNATVSVYSRGGHVATYHVPVNKEGIVWEVFEIRNGVLTPIQRYYDNLDNQSWWSN